MCYLPKLWQLVWLVCQQQVFQLLLAQINLPVQRVGRFATRLVIMVLVPIRHLQQVPTTLVQYFQEVTTSPVSTIATAVAAKTTTTITANSETLGTLGQRTWRNAGSTECIFAKYIDFATTGSFDYNPQLAGSQRFEANDIALGGFSTTATVQAGYYYTATTDSPVFRMGRSFTSVQMQSNAAGTAPATGFVHLPINGPSVPASGTEINGVGQTASSTGTPPGPNPGSVAPTAAQQTSEIRTNWVDFVLDNTGGVDEDGTTSQNSPVLYVQAACNGSTANTAGTIRIRQTGQETQPWVTILATGQTRVGANASF